MQISIVRAHIFIVCFLFLLCFSGSVFAQKEITKEKNPQTQTQTKEKTKKKEKQKAPSKDAIRLISPFDNAMTTRDRVLFKGVVKGVKTLKIGNIRVAIGKNGRFYHRQYLKLKNAYNTIEVIGITKTGEEIKKTLRIFRVHKEFESDRLDAALDSIHSAYQSLGWVQKPFVYSVRRYLSDQVVEGLKRSGTINMSNVLEEEAQVEIMMQYAELLRKDNTALIIIPWTGNGLYLEEYSNHLVRIIDNMSMMTLKNFGILWFNRELSILENYSSRPTVSEPLNFVKWILNDDHVVKLGTVPQHYKQFASERFFVDYRKITKQKMRQTKENVMNHVERLRTYHSSPQYKKALTYQGKGYYYILTGTFSKYDNAQLLQGDMRTEGYTTDVVPFEQKDGVILYRVQLGPFESKGDADRLDKELRALGFETFIIKT